MGPDRLPCAREALHTGWHKDRLGNPWIVRNPVPAVSAETEAAYRASEFQSLTLMGEALWARLRAGEDTTLLRARIDRIEALKAALCGFPEALAQ
jgi:hypothetical protein